MFFVTTEKLDGAKIVRYHGVVAAEVVMGSNFVRDAFARVRDFVGGRSGAYEKVFADARAEVMAEIEKQANELGANGIVGIRFERYSVGRNDSILMVSASGTAVTAAKEGA